PHSQTDSTPNATAVRTIEPTLNGWLTESSSSASRPSVRRRHSRLSRFTSVGRSSLGLPLAGAAPCTPSSSPVSSAIGRLHNSFWMIVLYLAALPSGVALVVGAFFALARREP